MSLVFAIASPGTAMVLKFAFGIANVSHQFIHFPSNSSCDGRSKQELGCLLAPVCKTFVSIRICCRRFMFHSETFTEAVRVNASYKVIRVDFLF